ncbi:FolC bifunctional protein [Trametopsis cervina]|nr:FolC bifunctional protein [Trametopsis cervina]
MPSLLRLLSHFHIPGRFPVHRLPQVAAYRVMSTRTYGDAVDHLNSLQTNAATLDAVRASGGRLSEFAIPEMLEYLGRIGYSAADLNKLNVIHVTGTKGKGSTCAFVDSIIREVQPSWKVGLYTSPHLVAVRERIRINGAPISEEDFARFFFEVWDRLDANDVRAHPDTSAKPAYFRFVTLVAYHAFLSLKVDATILEVGVGGTYDSTNIVPQPVVTGITALGIDHVGILGKTLKEIAWQKGGIYKPGVPAFTVPQPEEGLKVLRARAEELKSSEFVVVSQVEGVVDLKLGLPGKHQYQNANLAIHLAKRFLKEHAQIEPESVLSPLYVEALRKAKWPGRCQTVSDPVYPGLTWFLDGSHTLESLDCCIEWFVDPTTGLRTELLSRPLRVLIFNCTSGRSGESFLGAIFTRLVTQLRLHNSEEQPTEFFDRIIFCTNVTYASGGFKGDLTSRSILDSGPAYLKTQQELAEAWRKIVPTYPEDHIHVLPSIEHAVNIVRQEDRPADILVAGSLHLVGGAIEVAGLSDVAL